MQLSPTIVTLTRRKLDDKQVIMKCIQKKKLVNEVQKNYARQECTI